MTLRKVFRYVIPTLGVLVLLWLLVSLLSCTQAQTLDTEWEAEVALWNQHTSCIQHTVTAGGEVEGRFGPAFAEIFAGWRWWGACDAKIPSSPLNAESGLAYTRRHGVNLGLSWRGLQLGATLRRRADQFVWRHADRHDHFPASWQVGRHGCRGEATPSRPAGEGCPSIGYWDGIRVYLGYEGHGASVEVIGPPWTWKTLTLPWPRWRATASYEFGRWHVSGQGRLGGPAHAAGHLSLSRRIAPRLWIGAKVGRAAAPGWLAVGADYISMTVRIRPSQ